MSQMFKQIVIEKTPPPRTSCNRIRSLTIKREKSVEKVTYLNLSVFVSLEQLIIKPNLNF